MRSEARLLAVVLAGACGSPPPADPVAHALPDALLDDAILLAPEDLAIVGTIGMPATATAMVSGTGAVVDLLGVETTDPAIAWIDPPCALGGCAFTPGALPLPRQVTLGCTPAAVPRTATVTVTGANGVTDTSTVTCEATASGPALSVPGSVGPITAQVGEPAPAALVVTNTGDQMLAVSVTLAATTEWTAGACVAPATCAVEAGAMLSIPLELTPAQHGARNSSLQVTTTPDTGTKQVTLFGTGFGGVLRVDEPATFAHSFGTIATGQIVTFAVEMTNTGNQELTVTPSALPAPFTVATGPVTLAANGGTGSFDVTCSSLDATGPFSGTIDLAASANTYDRNTEVVDVACTIADTTAQVAPAPIEFGELRVGDPEGTITVTVTNPPGGGPIMVQRIALRDAPDALTRAPPSTMLPAVLADGAELTTELRLATTADVELDGVVLEVELVEGSAVVLELPVTGKVGTPRAVVVPARLALGTVCVGTPVQGEVALTNTGSVTLEMLRPSVMPEVLRPTFTNPTDYPEPPAGVPLREGDAAIVGVVPDDPALAGKLEATLAWDVDVPLAPFLVPISLEYLDSGTAVSPASMSFGTRDLGTRSPAQIVTLENCGSEPVAIAYTGVRSRERDPAAWILEPASHQGLLEPEQALRILVAFEPREPGPHRAELAIAVDGVPHVVELDGAGLGVPIEQTSFYACACSGGGAPARGWPLAFAIAVVLRRRRPG